MGYTEQVYFNVIYNKASENCKTMTEVILSTFIWEMNNKVR